MLVFIDESGCPGFKLARGSSAEFAIGMVQFMDAESAATTEAVIHALHNAIPHRAEFKFSKTSRDVKDKFFSAVRHSPFEVHVVVVQKSGVYSPDLRKSPAAFYNHFLRLLLDSGAISAKAKIRLDGSGGREFARALKTHLRNQLPDSLGDFRLVESDRDQLAQLADMCVGAVARSYREDREERTRWSAMLAPRIKNVWTFR